MILMEDAPVEVLPLKKVKTILVSQPHPVAKNPYAEMEQRYGVKVDFRSFIHVEAYDSKEYRRQRIRPDEFSAIIMTSKNAVDHFFRICEESRIKMSEDTKYFCLTDTIANYLQKFIVFRKRKVVSGTKTIHDLMPFLIKSKDKEKFLLPCSNLGALDITTALRQNNIPFQECIMFQTVSSDLSDLSDVTYDVLAFFSPLDIKSLFDNFPDFKQNATRIAVSGNLTANAVRERGDIEVNIQTSPEAPSMPMALEKYIVMANK